MRKKGIFVSPGGVRSIWLWHQLSCLKNRLSLLERKSAEEGFILTESQVTALEKKKDDDLACGEIETVHPGYLGSQDTFYVGNLKGVGRIYQQTFVDTYSKVAFAKLYTTKTPITSADLLNDKVLPFFEEHGMNMLRILTDRGTPICTNLFPCAYENIPSIYFVMKCVEFAIKIRLSSSIKFPLQFSDALYHVATFRNHDIFPCFENVTKLKILRSGKVVLSFPSSLLLSPRLPV